MAKIKLTKTQKKAEQDALRQYQRFLPTLQLKKQQLLLELRQSADRLEAAREAFERENERLAVFAGLFGDAKLAAEVASRVHITAVKRGEMNIAGITVPTFEDVEFAGSHGDLFVDDIAVEDCIEALKTVIRNREAYAILEEQHRLLAGELATTTQRVNLFEKVKIPETLENIRKITIYLSDQDTAAVVRSKIAKNKNPEVAA